jgi:uncharacterized protein
MGSIRVVASPGARVERISIEDTGEVKVWINAPPVEGRANRRLVEYLSERLGIAKSRVFISKGAGARIKTIEVEGMDRVEVVEMLRARRP